MVVEQAFRPVKGGGQTVNEWGTNQRIRPQTADRGRQTAEWTVVERAFRPVRERAIHLGEQKLCDFVSEWFVKIVEERCR